jgi:hypothetical protein
MAHGGLPRPIYTGTNNQADAPRKMDMVDIDAKVRALIEHGATRKDMLRELVAVATAAEKRAKQYARGTKDQRPRAQEERAIATRVGRLLFFLHRGTPADGATDADRLLYDLMEKVPL